MRLTHTLSVASLALILTACPKDKADTGELTAAEAAEAIGESTASSQAQALTSSSIEISTSFKMGDGAQKAAEEIKTFVTSQLPCADITLADATLTVNYGAKPGVCVYKGNTFKGTHAIKVSKNEDNQVIVDHTWTKFTNGKVTVDGTARATWDFSAISRKVDHDLTWSRPDGLTGKDTGTATQRPLPGGLKEGLQLDGDRTWTGKSGRWDLKAEGVEARWQDPVPQAGTFRLGSPKNKSLTLSFKRIDEDSIAVTLTNGSKSFTFNVNSVGAAVDKT